MSGWTELYPDADDMMGVPFGTDEFSRNPNRRRSTAPSMTAEEFAAFINPPRRPAVTAYKGADIDAYYFDDGVWRHCLTGEIWE